MIFYFLLFLNTKATENLPILIQKSKKIWLKYKKNCAFKSTFVMFTKKVHKKVHKNISQKVQKNISRNK